MATMQEMRTIGLAKAHEIAKAKGGCCLSKKYINLTKPLIFQCGKGHVWETTLATIKISWCEKCGLDKLKAKGLAKAHAVAKMHKGKCLSDSYINNSTKLLWECKHGHIWERSLGKHVAIHWCPDCHKRESIGEKICRNALEKIFGAKFNKARPEWLKSKKGFSLEFDGYNEKLAIAFEHNGIQHYSESKFLHKARSFKETIAYDRLKLNLARKHGVKIIVVPEIPTLTKLHTLKQVIMNECLRLEIPLPENFEFIDVLQNYHYCDDEIAKLKDFCQKKGGDCLSETYTGVDSKYEFICKYGHKWWASKDSVMGRKKHWCHECGGSKVGTIEEMHKIASKKNGLCLSKQYINSHTHLRWQCKEKHQWDATPTSIKGGSWCPYCHHNRQKVITIDDMKLFAHNMNGECLSTEYIKNSNKLRWRCCYGHEWSRSWTGIQRVWCLQCKKREN